MRCRVSLIRYLVLTYRFIEIQAVNLTGATIIEVVIGTDKSVSCDSLNQFAMCQDYFNSTPYPATGVELSRAQSDGKSRLGGLIPRRPILRRV